MASVDGGCRGGGADDDFAYAYAYADARYRYRYGYRYRYRLRPPRRRRRARSLATQRAVAASRHPRVRHRRASTAIRVRPRLARRARAHARSRGVARSARAGEHAVRLSNARGDRDGTRDTQARRGRAVVCKRRCDDDRDRVDRVDCTHRRGRARRHHDRVHDQRHRRRLPIRSRSSAWRAASRAHPILGAFWDLLVPRPRLRDLRSPRRSLGPPTRMFDSGDKGVPGKEATRVGAVSSPTSTRSIPSSSASRRAKPRASNRNSGSSSRPRGTRSRTRICRPRGSPAPRPACSSASTTTTT